LKVLIWSSKKKISGTKNDHNIDSKEETPSSNGVVWAYDLCCWASKSICILVFRRFGKIKSAGPRLWAPAWFFWLIISTRTIHSRSQPPSTTPFPVFLSGNNWFLNWSHYQQLPMLPRKKNSEIFVFYYNLVISVEKHWLFLRTWWNIRKKTLIWEGSNLSSIPAPGFWVEKPSRTPRR
jgi:hypothetical protein